MNSSSASSPTSWSIDSLVRTSMETSEPGVYGPSGSPAAPGTPSEAMMIGSVGVGAGPLGRATSPQASSSSASTDVTTRGTEAPR